MSLEWALYPVMFVVLFLLALRTYGHIEERKSQIQAKSEADKAKIYADQRTQQARLDGLTDIRLAGLNAGAGDDSQLTEAMNMLGMMAPGMLQGQSEVPSSDGTDSVSTDLHNFAKTEKGKDAMKDFVEWKKENGI